jgi:ABC-type multidrug transport system permease subunit
VGWVYDTTSSYITVFGLMALLLVAAGLLAGFIQPPGSLLRGRKRLAVS